MKLHTWLMAGVAGTVLLGASAAAAGQSADVLGVLVARIKKASVMPDQSRYSHEIQKSVNSAAIQDMARTCAQSHPGLRAQTFTLLGIMRIDGVLKAPIALPDNAFTSCIVDNVAATHFPLPPGNAGGWPVGIQFDSATGKALYMAGDKQAAMPQYQSYSTSAMHWVYTPVPIVPATLRKSCAASVWMTVGADGHVESADTGDSSCPSALNKAVVDAASQWLKVSTSGSSSGGSMDVRISFSITKTGVKVTL